jgi:hypothetical protein
MPLLLLVSVMTSPNAWFTDEAIVLPAILYGLYRTSDAGWSLIPYCCVAGVALIEVFANIDISSAFISGQHLRGCSGIYRLADPG